MGIREDVSNRADENLAKSEPGSRELHGVKDAVPGNGIEGPLASFQKAMRGDLAMKSAAMLLGSSTLIGPILADGGY